MYLRHNFNFAEILQDIPAWNWKGSNPTSNCVLSIYENSCIHYFCDRFYTHVQSHRAPRYQKLILTILFGKTYTFHNFTLSLMINTFVWSLFKTLFKTSLAVDKRKFINTKRCTLYFTHITIWNKFVTKNKELNLNKFNVLHNIYFAEFRQSPEICDKIIIILKDHLIHIFIF